MQTPQRGGTEIQVRLADACERLPARRYSRPVYGVSGSRRISNSARSACHEQGSGPCANGRFTMDYPVAAKVGLDNKTPAVRALLWRSSTPDNCATSRATGGPVASYWDCRSI